MSFNLLKTLKIERAANLIEKHPNSVLFVTSLLRSREVKLAAALRGIGWKVILLYKKTTPFSPADYFDLAIPFTSDRQIHNVAMLLRPRICHVFSGAIDDLALTLCRNKPSPVVLDLNDIFCKALFRYHPERFEPTRECVALADGFCARDLQIKFAERIDGFTLLGRLILFPEYSWVDGPALPQAKQKRPGDEVHVVSIGTFCLETQGMYDSAYLQLARLLTGQGIHFHIYPHWDYLAAPKARLQDHFRDFFKLQSESPFMHMHESVPFDRLAEELTQYDFGMVSGAKPEFAQKMSLLTTNYMKSCYSGRISDYIDARLPVLINREVAYNYRMLEHYGIVADLGGVLQPGFREKLLELKRDPDLHRRVQKAADYWDLHRHAKRLADFYSRVSLETTNSRVGLPSWIVAAAVTPIVARRIVGPLNAVVSMQSRLMSMRSEIKRLSKENQGYVSQNAQLRGEIGRLQDEISLGSQPIRNVAGYLNWESLLDTNERVSGFAELMRILGAFERNKKEIGLSAAWEALNKKTIDALLADGYVNFKRTLGLNYFTFPIQAGDPQLVALESRLEPAVVEKLREQAWSLPDDPNFIVADQKYYRFFVLLLAEYVRTRDSEHLLTRIKEPAEGNPVVVPFRLGHVSQDIANSILEYYSISEANSPWTCRNVLEIGGGYGRTAYVIRSLHPEIRYVMVDIPPAIYVAQRYLSSVFDPVRVLRVPDFEHFSEIEEQFERASIVFMLPNQLKKLPAKTFDLAINISSFGEMTRDQIDYYFTEIDRTVSGLFYSKQWQHSSNPFDGLNLSKADYPAPPHWTEVYSRLCSVQTDFFEAMYKVP